MTEFVGTAKYFSIISGPVPVNLIGRNVSDEGWDFSYADDNDYKTWDVDNKFSNINLFPIPTVKDYILTADGDFTATFTDKDTAIAAARTLRDYLLNNYYHNVADRVKLTGPVLPQREVIDF